MPAFGNLSVGTLFYYQNHIGQWALYVKTLQTEGYQHFVNCDRVGAANPCLFSDGVECDTKLRTKDGRLVLTQEAHPVITKFLDTYCASLERRYWILGAQVFNQELHVSVRGNPPKDVTDKLPSVFDGFKVVLCSKFSSRNQGYASPEAFG